MRRILIVLSVVAGCGGSDPGSISGTVHGKAISVSDAVSSGVTIPAGHAAVVLLANKGNLCTDLGANIEHPSEAGVIITMYDVNGTAAAIPSAPGTYTIYQGSGTFPPHSAGLSVVSTDATCKDVTTDEAKAMSGTVTLKSVSGNKFTGSYDVALDSGDHITGSFDPEECASLQNVLSGSAAPSCQ